MAKIAPLPTREAIRKNRRERLENGMLFPLTVTSLGFDMEEPIQARVRRISTVDKATLEGLPTPLQDVIYNGLREFEARRKEAQGMADPEDLAGMLSNNATIVAAADAFCQAAFIHPRLVKTEREIDGPDVWLVEDVDPEDRVAVFMACMDPDSPQMKKLKIFRPEWGVALRDDAPRAVAETAERHLETEPAGV